MGPIISVVVPVYKAEPYLCKCIDSICNQTFRELEIILVDDGSPDNSGKICDEYAATDSRVRVIHKENGGVSTARNAGLAAATGEYIGFVDSDDWIEADMYETLYRLIQQEDADIAVCQYDNCADKTEVVRPIDTPAHTVIDAIQALKQMLGPSKTGLYLWNRLVKRSLYEGLMFPAGKICEETYVIIPATDKAKAIVVTQSCLYHYVIRDDSYTTNKAEPKYLDIIEGYAFPYHYIEQNHPNLLTEAAFRRLYGYFYALDRIAKATVAIDKNKKMEIVQYLREHRREILHNPLFSWKRKLAILLLSVHVKLYESISRFSGD